MVKLMPVTEDNRSRINDFITRQWFSTVIVIRGEMVDMTCADGFIAYEDGEIIGLVTYRIIGDECEITSLDSLLEGRGTGTSLIKKVVDTAVEKKCRLVKLITTNDNINALRFYQKRGFDMTNLYYNAIEISRKLKPSIPLTGNYGIPIRHEIEFTLKLKEDNSGIHKTNAIETDGIDLSEDLSKTDNSVKAKAIANHNEILIYTDGSARGNPDGPGGYGTILVYVDSKGAEHEREYSAGYKKTTNNRMELMAAIVGLEALTKPCSVTLYSDSQYLIKAFNENWLEGWIKKGWKRSQNDPVKNIDLWKRLLRAMEPHKVSFEWVRGHNGHPMNERCDKLATAAADGDNLLEDVITE